MDASSFPIMLGFSQIPVSPPPDHKLLFKQPAIQTPAAALSNPLLFKQFAREMEAPAVKKAPSLLEKHFQEQQMLLAKAKQDKIQAQQHKAQAQVQSQSQPSPQPCCTTPTTSPSTLASSTSNTSSAETKVSQHQHQHQSHKEQQQQQQPKQQQQHPQSSPPPPPENPFHLSQAGLLDPSTSSDPKYAQMASRMASYYQQRCQAILNYQQQRCQTWATSHRQKCQEMMQAAMLVVAWYIRDRIGRRRRRNKRAFRRGLREKNQTPRRAGGRGAGAAPTRGEAVRRWVMNIPEAALSPNNGMRDDGQLDKEEREFDVEKETTPDKDSQLFTVADQMIKSQLAKIDVPLLGALNLEDSDSESESEEEAYYYDDLEDDEMADEDDGGEADEDYEYDDDDLDLDEESEDYVEDVASKEAMHGTGKGSLKRKRSESTSEVE